jgi:hypothetical protein
MINDTILQSRWIRIARHLPVNTVNVQEYRGTLSCSFNNFTFYISKNSTKFRLKSHLDWAWYTPKTFADAIKNNTLESYYEIMLNDVNSDPNEWKDRDIEMELKSYYANRANRCDLIP